MSSQNERELQDLRDQMQASSEALKRQIVTDLAFNPNLQISSSGAGDRKVIAVPYDGKSLFPAFQFDNQQRPLPIIEHVLRLFSEDAPYLLIGRIYFGRQCQRLPPRSRGKERRVARGA